MAGVGASSVFLGSLECEASSSMAIAQEALVDSFSPPTSVEVGTLAVTEDVLQKDEVNSVTMAVKDGPGLVSAQPDPVSSDAVPFSSVIDDNVEDCLISGHLPGAYDLRKGTSSILISERGKSLAEVRGTKLTQVCAICHDKIKAEETAEIKGVTCILRWASYKSEPWCPQCRLPFSFLYVYRALDGTLLDYLCEESVCLLLRAFWFKPLVIQEPEEQEDYQDDYDVFEESYYPSNLRLGNRRWGDSGYVRAGRREARPVVARQVVESGGGMSSSSRQAKGKEPVKEAVGRRARRAQKREQLDKMSSRK